MINDQGLIQQYLTFLKQRAYPCIGAKAAVEKDHISCCVVDSMECPGNDSRILTFLYDFVTVYRKAPEPYHSAAVIFRHPHIADEKRFDALLWQRLDSLRQLDKQRYDHDPRVSPDPSSPNFSFSIMEEAFFIIGLHPASERKARRFEWPTLVFNPHAEFVKLRERNRYETMKKTIRKRDVKFSGSVNPMLKDFGEESEVFQYSGMAHGPEWKCPLKS